MMQLALRRTAASDARWYERIFARLIRWRLCSAYCHSGVVINGRMYHSNARNGLHATSYDPSKWELFEVPGADVEQVLETFRNAPGGYNWIAVLHFILPLFPHRRGGRSGYYCFQWSAAAMGLPDHKRHTPETLLRSLHVTPRRPA